jgi:uncharacterized protein (DUF58 family)
VTETQQRSVIDQLGGLSGLIYSSLPILIFVPVNSIWNLTAAIWAALGVAVAIAAWRWSSVHGISFSHSSTTPTTPDGSQSRVSAWVGH